MIESQNSILQHENACLKGKYRTGTSLQFDLVGDYLKNVDQNTTELQGYVEKYADKQLRVHDETIKNLNISLESVQEQLSISLDEMSRIKKFLRQANSYLQMTLNQYSQTDIQESGDDQQDTKSASIITKEMQTLHKFIVSLSEALKK